MKKINKNHNSIPQIDANHYRLVWRDITNAIDRRTLISTILPPNVFLGNTLLYIRPTYFDGEKYHPSLSNAETLFLCGIFNSFPIDFILRHRVNLHVSIFFIMELPVPRYDENNVIHKQIMENAAKLICVSEEYNTLKKSVGINYGISDDEKRMDLMAQLNASSCKLYDLDKSDVEFILKNFTVENVELKELTLNKFELMD